MHNLENSKKSLIEESSPFFLETGSTWLQQTLKIIASSDQVTEDLGLYSAMAKRKLGNALLDSANAINNQYDSVHLQYWSSADAGRLIMLMVAVLNNLQQTEKIITQYYRMGDEAEHIALIRGLIFFAPSDFLTQLALDAGRSNNLEVLSALTLDNPYPASFYSEQEFNQMVLKALFLGMSIERVAGIRKRANAELARMGEDYVVEREQAGRSVPVDIWLAIGPFASESGKKQITQYLNHEDSSHRYYCTLALIQQLSQDTSLAAILEERLQREQHPLIVKLLQDNLQK